MTKPQAICLRLIKLFSNEEIIEWFFDLCYLIDFYFPKYKLAIEVDDLGHKDRGQTKQNEWQKDLKEYLDCIYNINSDKKNFGVYDGLKKKYCLSLNLWEQKISDCQSFIKTITIRM